MRNYAISSLRRTIVPAIVFFASILMLADSSSIARNIQLLANGSGDYATIQSALLAATNGDTITLADGTYLGDGNRDLDVLGKQVTIRSQSGQASACIIDCQGSAVAPHRGFDFHFWETNATRLQNVTICNAWGYPAGWYDHEPGGGAIRCMNSSPTIEGCIFINNHADWGGGLHTYRASSPVVVSCRFEGNTATFGGGGMSIIPRVEGEPAVISNPVICGCDFVSNSTQIIGGGLLMVLATADISNCRFINNEASDSGGGLYRRICPPMTAVQSCVFQANCAGDGGGVALYREGNTDFIACTFYGNIGAVGACGKSAEARGLNPIMPQSPVGTASAICTYNGATGSMSRCIAAFAPDGAAVDNPYSGGPVAITQCDIFGNVDGPGIVASQLGVNGNIALDPLFCDAADGDLTLWSNSPCAADNNGGVLIGALEVACYAPPPWQLLIGDVPDDQGGFLICSWGRHTNDLAGQSPLVTYYELQRQDAAWTFLTLVAAAQADSYSVTIATPDILTIGQTVIDHDYRLIARTVDPATNFVTESVAAVSIDNIPPSPPALELFDSETYRYLNWDNPTDADFDQTCVYRSDSQGIEGGEPLVCSATPFWYQETDLNRYWYRARSYDIHGNASEWSNEVVGRYPTGVPGSLPTVLRLYPNQPNPFNPMTTLRFDIPVGGVVRLDVFDVAGRLVRTLLDVDLLAGCHSAVWDGTDSAGRGMPSGTYFARLSASGQLETVRMGLLR